MFPGGKDGRCVGLKPYHLHVPIVLKSGSLTILEPSGPVQACNRIAVPLPHVVRKTRTFTFQLMKLFVRIFSVTENTSWSDWPRCPRYCSAVAHFLGLQVQIPPETWSSVCCEGCVLSGRGLRQVDLSSRRVLLSVVVWVWLGGTIALYTNGSDSLLLGSQGIRTQFLADPWAHFWNGCFEVYYILNEGMFLKKNRKRL
jgi:hypothetical protein